MAIYDDINNVEPGLFDALEPNETAESSQETDERIAAILKREADKLGVWQIIPSGNLIQRAGAYYEQRETQIRKLLQQSGMTADAANTVLADYLGVLNGIFVFGANTQQMRQALKAIKPYDAFNIDRFGLYFGLLLNYSRFLLRRQEYDDTVKAADVTHETKLEYIAFGESIKPADAMAVKWLISTGYIEPSDFAGIDPAEMNNYFSCINIRAQLGEYSTYYTIARLALVATHDELAVIETPPYLTDPSINDFCEQVAKETAQGLNSEAEKFGIAITANTEQEQEQARRAANSWQDGANRQTAVLYDNYVKVLSKPVKISRNGAEIVERLPIKTYIDEFNKQPIRFGNISSYPAITEQAVIRAIDGVGLLPTYLQGRMITEDRRLVFHTNLSEFSQICGYADAGQADQRALLGALLLLRNLYIIVDRPYKSIEYKGIKGRKRRKRIGGPTAIQFVNIPEVGLTSGELIIEAYRESFLSLYRKTTDGKQIPNNTFIDLCDYNKLRSKAKGTSQYRFNTQIATKSHKSERALIYEIFGLEDMLSNAPTEDNKEAAKTYIRKHYAGFRKKMLGWFDEYLSDGIITEFNREQSKTDKKDYILTWKCPDPKGLIPPPLVPDEQKPDEQ